MKKNKRERDEDSMRHGDQYDTQLLWFLMRHMRNRRPQRVSMQNDFKKTPILDSPSNKCPPPDPPWGRRARHRRVLELSGFFWWRWRRSRPRPVHVLLSPPPHPHTPLHIHKHTCINCPLIDAQKKASTIDTLAHSSRRATFLFFYIEPCRPH